MRQRNSAVFILSFGRADRVYTYETLRKCGYTGKIYLICSDDDQTLEQYKERFGKENVLVFNKEKTARYFDQADNFKERKTVVFARNVCFYFAEKLKLDCFVELDDDYVSFEYRTAKFGKFYSRSCANLDAVFDVFLKFLFSANIDCVAMAQGGDFIGGAQSGSAKSKIKRKIMNVFFCRCDKPFYFLGRINEDVNTYALLQQQGKLFFTVTKVMITQKQTQSNSGGMTNVYEANGTYLKTFYSVIFAPSCVKVAEMGDGHSRIHHKVLGKFAYPKILSEEHKKLS